MGLSFYRSFKFGPLRVNLSGRGIGLSGGVRGARVSVGPRGTYVTAGRGGFRYRAKLTDQASTKPLPAHASSPQVSDALDSATAPGMIATASVSSLASSSPDASLQEMQRRINASAWLPVYLVTVLSVAIGVAAIAPQTWRAAILLAWGVALLVGAYFVHSRDRERTTARIIYDVDCESLLERFAFCNAVGEALAGSNALWHVYSSVATSDRKRNAGASTLIRRTRVRCTNKPLRHFEMNIVPWSIPVGPQRLMFLPDRLLVIDGKQLAGIPYEQLEAVHAAVNFVEDESAPADSRQVDTTWRYVNKSGGPDRRFKDNRPLPIMEYGELTLRTNAGLQIILNASRPAATERASAYLRSLRSTALQVPPGQVMAAARPEQLLGGLPAQGPARPPCPAGLSEEMQSGAVSRAVATLLRSLAAADRRISDDEVQFSSAAIGEFCPNDNALAIRLATDFRKLPSDEGSVLRAIDTIRAQPEPTIRRVRELLEALVHADGKVTPKEAERLSGMLARLEQ